ncbi:hypothetical protein GZ178_11370 [Dermatophilus congolensis]|uniref:hypothetical protein n=6 Tax=Dermatophilus congolensis TaxID=1863 RepID=UPI001AAE9D3B|nr:hypothetical protein [Dermatophilus congolensis]MBO3153040.1 hypothetical protein [Dermatophilus congolensis]MBO3184648.1 hypothetical protein [Dermatophilus congolensis]
MSGKAPTIAFTGASGGLGTSCLLAATAVAASAAGYRVACIDRDTAGGGLDTIFGLDHLPGARWPDLLGAHGHLPTDLLMRELPNEKNIWVLSHSNNLITDIPEEADRTTLEALTTGTDLVLIDAGRPRPAPPADDTTPHATTLDPRPWHGADHIVLLVGHSPQSLAAATAITNTAPETGPTWWLAQRTPKGATHLPETVQSTLGLALAARVTDDPRCHRDLLHGEPPGQRGHLAKAANQLLSTLLTQGHPTA